MEVIDLPFNKDWFLRIAMASVFLYHGLTKNLEDFAKTFNFHLLFASLVIFAEMAGGLGYLLGGLYDKNILGYSLT